MTLAQILKHAMPFVSDFTFSLRWCCRSHARKLRELEIASNVFPMSAAAMTAGATDVADLLQPSPPTPSASTPAASPVTTCAMMKADSLGPSGQQCAMPATTAESPGPSGMLRSESKDSVDRRSDCTVCDDDDAIDVDEELAVANNVEVGVAGDFYEDGSETTPQSLKSLPASTRSSMTSSFTLLPPIDHLQRESSIVDRQGASAVSRRDGADDDRRPPGATEGKSQNSASDESEELVLTFTSTGRAKGPLLAFEQKSATLFPSQVRSPSALHSEEPSPYFETMQPPCKKVRADISHDSECARGNVFDGARHVQQASDSLALLEKNAVVTNEKRTALAIFGDASFGEEESDTGSINREDDRHFLHCRRHKREIEDNHPDNEQRGLHSTELRVPSVAGGSWSFSPVWRS